MAATRLNKTDREFLIKLANRLEVLEQYKMSSSSDIENLKKNLEKYPDRTGNHISATQPNARHDQAGGNRPDPLVIVSSRFSIKGVSTMNEQTLAQTEIRKFVTEFCRNAGIEEMHITFSEVAPGPISGLSPIQP